MQQITNTILMVRPTSFRANEQTAVNNFYQKELTGISQETLQERAVEEFDAFVKGLRSIGVEVIVYRSTDDLDTPDAHFPNNWISFHENATVGLYPMFAENRRLERREGVILQLESEGFKIENIVDYTGAEEEGLFLEATGSLVLDRVNRKAYCALSQRADEELVIEFCEDFDYLPVIFRANQTVNGRREAIYHTNVMMCLAETFAVICLDCIDDKKERQNVIHHLNETNKEIIRISEEQVTNFAGNMLQVIGKGDQRYCVMSQAAYDSLRPAQIALIEKHCNIFTSSLKIIEACGGGSARCMMAEVFLPIKR
ncbi:MAG: amidinotransferase [Bacteroidia bacterium]|nr:amidinotransferase [Bacteroidia bacterium]MBT8279342.1 amidinotransferase [Bacteroidia bacterium]NND26818.1 amidinotransferase [Flavobacteriaceae bacterium]NNK61170.1 amidinotransferase [Flavobacteriaceae bacterium]RZW54225.1 MAG: amidinotransferase [Flavobacteriaceae bacterium]